MMFPTDIQQLEDSARSGEYYGYVYVTQPEFVSQQPTSTQQHYQLQGQPYPQPCQHVNEQQMQQQRQYQAYLQQQLLQQQQMQMQYQNQQASQIAHPYQGVPFSGPVQVIYQALPGGVQPPAEGYWSYTPVARTPPIVPKENDGAYVGSTP